MESYQNRGDMSKGEAKQQVQGSFSLSLLVSVQQRGGRFVPVAELHSKRGLGFQS